ERARIASARPGRRRRGCAATAPVAPVRSGRGGSSLRKPSVVRRACPPPPRRRATAPAESARSAAPSLNSLSPCDLQCVISLSAIRQTLSTATTVQALGYQRFDKRAELILRQEWDRLMVFEN